MSNTCGITSELLAEIREFKNSKQGVEITTLVKRPEVKRIIAEIESDQPIDESCNLPGGKNVGGFTGKTAIKTLILAITSKLGSQLVINMVLRSLPWAITALICAFTGNPASPPCSHNAILAAGQDILAAWNNDPKLGCGGYETQLAATAAILATWVTAGIVASVAANMKKWGLDDEPPKGGKKQNRKSKKVRKLKKVRKIKSRKSKR
jgi:hypothetical protein